MNVIINEYRGLARVLLMHAIGTSLAFWVFTIVRETADAIALSDDKQGNGLSAIFFILHLHTRWAARITVIEIYIYCCRYLQLHTQNDNSFTLFLMTNAADTTHWTQSINNFHRISIHSLLNFVFWLLAFGIWYGRTSINARRKSLHMTNTIQNRRWLWMAAAMGETLPPAAMIVPKTAVVRAENIAFDDNSDSSIYVWLGIDRPHSAMSLSNCVDHENDFKTSSLVYADCQASFRGIFAGVLLIVITIVFIILLFVGVSNEYVHILLPSPFNDIFLLTFHSPCLLFM